MNRSLLLTLALALGVVACEPYEPPKNEFEREAEAQVSAGSANFSKYVAVGNSLTAGFYNNALSNTGMVNSYPALLAQQFRAAGGGAFNQLPLPAGTGFGGVAGPSSLGEFQVRYVSAPTNPCDPMGPALLPSVSIGPSLASIDPTSMDWRPSSGQSTNQNWAVPGVTLGGSLTPTLSTLIPFYGRIATAPGSSTLIGDAAAQNPTFFSFWLGNNDILGFAASGGLQPSTDVATFTSQLNLAMDPMLASNGGNNKGIVANIPPVTAIPQFTTVVSRSFPPAPAATLTAAQAGGINALWTLWIGLMTNPASQPLFSLNSSTDFPDGIGATTLPRLPGQTPAQFFTSLSAYAGNITPPTFVAGVRTNGVVVQTGNPTSLGFGIRMSNANDLLLLTSQGSSNPLTPQRGTLNPNPCITYPISAGATLAQSTITGGITPPLVAGPGTNSLGLAVLTPPVVGQQDLYGLLDTTTRASLRSGLGIPAGTDVNLFFVPHAGPLRTQFVLDQAEVTFTNTRIADFNAAILNKVNAVNAATPNRLAFFDANAFFLTGLQVVSPAGTLPVVRGIRVGDARGQQLMTTSYPFGGLFSLDGVHPTPAGYAVVTNEMIKRINSTFGATIKEVDPRRYPAVVPVP